MSYFLRASTDIQADLERGYSYHCTPFSSLQDAVDYFDGDLDEGDFGVINDTVNIKLDGLCAIAVDDIDDMENELSLVKEFEGEVYLIEGEDVYESEHKEVDDGVCFVNGKVIRKI